MKDVNGQHDDMIVKNADALVGAIVAAALAPPPGPGF
jgi:hypothetical protein